MFYQPNWPDVAKACKSVSEKKFRKKSFAIHNITSKQKKKWYAKKLACLVQF